MRGPFLEPFLELMQVVLEVVEEWCRGTGSNVNPLKTGIVVFMERIVVKAFALLDVQEDFQPDLELKTGMVY